MYVYDGDSIYAPLIGVFSGLVVPEAKEKESVPEVVTTSGYALLHFFSDAAYNLTGFNIAYSVNSCPNNCSGHGRCSAGNSEAGRVYCECDEYWKGEACAVPYCRDDCGSPDHGYCDLTGEKLWSNLWQVVSVGGAVVQGGYGHSSVYDQAGGCVYIHGGYTALSNNKYGLVDHMYRYVVSTRTWLILRESRLPRYLHSAVLLSGTMLVFGGNTHNDTSLSNGAKCFSTDFLAYDIACDKWTVLPRPGLHRDVNRFGHSAVVSNGWVPLPLFASCEALCLEAPLYGDTVPSSQFFYRNSGFGWF
uniref:EGF-like domain-containing protein n=1 Tax=Poecilia mexicana TaxID=48701 RepID=A0A3B3WD22_9TELE